MIIIHMDLNFHLMYVKKELPINMKSFAVIYVINGYI